MSYPRPYIPPSAGDSRSPCPALNALANHSILPRDGRNISVFQLISVLREYYNISLPLAILLSLWGTLKCGRHFKIDLQDLARHNVIEHGASLTHADALPGARNAPVAVNKELLQHLLDTSNPNVVTFDDLITVRASRDVTLRRSSWAHGVIARGVIALTVQTFGDEEGNMPKQYIQEWFGEERLPQGWTKPATTIGIWITTRISNWVGELLKKKLE
ncbi:Cloroperoxidase [Russula ochroleuca]|uniref:Cloroperoxidase n=1 Tax=Russula ochroleuca TaxID=152965 RepID=A0A9P5N265_9AGAM|nr:Cloroperoxidase [Russula ochroleuca]